MASGLPDLMLCTVAGARDSQIMNSSKWYMCCSAGGSSNYNIGTLAALLPA